MAFGSDIQIDDDYLTNIEKFIRTLRKKWNISDRQEYRLRKSADMIGTTQYAVSNGWDREKGESTKVRTPFIVGYRWVTGITKGGKLMIRFDGGFSTGCCEDKREGIIPRVYLSPL
tara:strand:- start:53 stop:400 length:348 start_codon:yes stop_codon:yes gene_type:complete